jgi:hypothetical protein
MALAALLNLSPVFSAAALAQQQQPAVPDAPTPQARPPLTGADGNPITPGIGAGNEPEASTSSSAAPAQQPPPPPAQTKDDVQTTPPELPAPGEGMAALSRVYNINVNFVEVPVTAKDSKGKLVAGRGIESAGTVQTLRNRKLIARSARLGPRRERTWRTTPLFLETFGLASLDELYKEGRMEEVFASVYSAEMGAEEGAAHCANAELRATEGR